MCIIGCYQEYLSKHETLIDKLQKADPVIDDDVVQAHLDTIKNITKSFIDSSAPDYKKCSGHAAFLAWASQYIILCQHAKGAAKFEKNIASLTKEMDQKKNNRATIQQTLDTFVQDGYITFLRDEIDGEQQRLETYQESRQRIVEDVVDEQKIYVNFEKVFFADLEQFVINKKMK